MSTTALLPRKKYVTTRNDSLDIFCRLENITESVSGSIRFETLHQAEKLKCFKAKAERGNLEYQLRLGNIFLFGNSSQQKCAGIIALYWYVQAAHQESPIAFNNAGIVLLRMAGGKEEYRKLALECLEYAERFDCLSASINIANYYLGMYINNGTALSLEIAFKKLKFASTKCSDAVVLNNLACMYYGGLGTEINLEDAYKCMEKAVSGESMEGYDSPKYNLGVFNALGLRPKNCKGYTTVCSDHIKIVQKRLRESVQSDQSFSIVLTKAYRVSAPFNLNFYL